jgi:hypothetical protein
MPASSQFEIHNFPSRDDVPAIRRRIGDASVEERIFRKWVTDGAP